MFPNEPCTLVSHLRNLKHLEAVHLWHHLIASFT